jgi:hypothetical protein
MVYKPETVCSAFNEYFSTIYETIWSSKLIVMKNLETIAMGLGLTAGFLINMNQFLRRK